MATKQDLQKEVNRLNRKYAKNQPNQLEISQAYGGYAVELTGKVDKWSKKYNYYRGVVCGNRINYNQEAIEDAIIKAIKDVVDTDEAIEYIATLMQEQLISNVKADEEKELRGQKDDAELQLQKISSAFLDANSAMRSALNQKAEEYQSKILAIEKKLEHINQVRLTQFGGKDMIKKFLKHFINRDLSVDKNRREFFQILLNTAFVNENHLDIYLNYDVEERISFSEYKNDLSDLQKVRKKVILAEQERLELSHQLPDLRP